MKKLLITGGCGYIGSHTCYVLLEAGYELVVVDSNINSSDIPLKRLKSLKYSREIDFGEEVKIFSRRYKRLNLNKVYIFRFKKRGNPIDAVIHFAGLKSVYESTFDPLSYWDANVVATISLLKVMKECKCQTIVLVVVHQFIIFLE